MIDDSNPAYRKATRNMLAADHVCQNVLSAESPEIKNQLGFILGTRFGEITSTLDFLRAYGEKKPLSPIHFQNSLHNSTLGFICINQKITGPALTISAAAKTEQALMDTAEAISLFVPYILICQVDYIPESLKNSYYLAYPDLKKLDGIAQASLFKKSNNNN